jgi:Tfp pilus assembly protein PilX
MTILSLSAMRTSSLEQLMAGNVQEMMRAFEAAESGANNALSDLANFNSMTAATTVPYNVTGSSDLLKSTATIYPPIALQITDCPRSATCGQSQKMAYYEQIIIGTTITGAQSTRDQGVGKSAPDAGPGSGQTVTTSAN